MAPSMDRDEAQKALELLKSVVAQARDDTVLQNWGRIWILHAFTNGGGFIATNLLIWRGVESRLVYCLLWLAIVVVNIGTIFVLKTRRSGAKSFIEAQIWSIWLTFIGAVVMLGVVNQLMGMPILALAPVIAILSAVGFASMGAVMGRRWYLGTVIFGGVAPLMALYPNGKFLILGVVWGLAQLVGGIWLESERKRRLGGATDAPRLV